MADAAMDPPGSVTGVVEKLSGLTHDDRISVRDIVEGFGDTAFVAMLIVPALIVLSPLSGIPILPSICGLIIALIAAQMVTRRSHLWLPEAVMARELSAARLRGVMARLRGIAGWLDRRAHARLQALVQPPLIALPQMLCVMAGLAMPFLELVPFSSSLLGLSVLFFCAGFLTRDGLFTVLGMGVMAVASMIPIAALTILKSG